MRLRPPATTAIVTFSYFVSPLRPASKEGCDRSSMSGKRDGYGRLASSSDLVKGRKHPTLNMTSEKPRERDDFDVPKLPIVP